MIPSGVQHSYVYHVEWTYSWSGTWGELFGSNGSISNQTSFALFRIAGSLHAVWRNQGGGPQVGCTLKIVPDMGDYPDFRARYDPSAGTLRIVGLEAPTERYGMYVGPAMSDPMCGGGPQIDVFGQPRDWKPLGDGGATLNLSGPGLHRYDRNWTWKHAFGGGLSRNYVSALRSTLQIHLST